MRESSASQMRAARSATAFRTGRTSVGEPEMTRRISLIAVCRSSASFVSLNRRTLSIAIAACRANVSISTTWSGENSPGVKRWTKMPPYAVFSRISGTASTARMPKLRMFSRASGNSVSTTACTSAKCTVVRSRTARPVIDVRFRGTGTVASPPGSTVHSARA